MIKLSCMEVKDGETPSWYYGLTYQNFSTHYFIFHIIPFNYIIRGYYFLCYYWNKFRTRPCFMDKEIILYKNKVRGEVNAAFEKRVEEEISLRLDKAVKEEISKAIKLYNKEYKNG